MGRSPAETRVTLVDVARKHKSVVQIGTQQRSEWSFWYAAELVRNGLRRAPGFQARKAFPCFAVRDDASPISLEATLQVEDGDAADLIA